jgi:hypothetical protein
MHFEVRVRAQGSLWEVRAGAYGRPQFFASASMALTHARRAAQLAWTDHQVAACVHVLADDGVWRTDCAFGPPARIDRAARDPEEAFPSR